jgi:hypothetical protein
MHLHIFQDLISLNKNNSLGKPSVSLCESSVSLRVMNKELTQWFTEKHRETQR